MKLQPIPKLQPSNVTMTSIHHRIITRWNMKCVNNVSINPLLAAASAQWHLSLCQTMASSFIKSSSCSSDRSDPPTLTIRLLMQGKVRHHHSAAVSPTNTLSLAPTSLVSLVAWTQSLYLRQNRQNIVSVPIAVESVDLSSPPLPKLLRKITYSWKSYWQLVYCVYPSLFQMSSIFEVKIVHFM